jgi:hypothetical protein
MAAVILWPSQPQAAHGFNMQCVTIPKVKANKLNLLGRPAPLCNVSVLCISSPLPEVVILEEAVVVKERRERMEQEGFYYFSGVMFGCLSMNMKRSLCVSVYVCVTDVLSVLSVCLK